MRSRRSASPLSASAVTARSNRVAITVQAERPIPTLPSHWSADEKVGYRSGWRDVAQHIRDALTFWDAPAAVAEGAEDRGQTDD